MTMKGKNNNGLHSLLTRACVLLALTFIGPDTVFAVPAVEGVKVTDVTTSSFSLVWITDIYGDPDIEVYSDINMANEITDTLAISPMPVGSPAVAEAARTKRIMKVLVSGLLASTKYYARAVMRDPEDPFNVGYSPLHEVVTGERVVPYGYAPDGVYGFSNDLAEFRVYRSPAGDTVGTGDLVIIESAGSRYPVSAFVGDGIGEPAGVLDLNNLFSESGISLDLTGGERLVVTVYRGGMLSTLTHYRRVAHDDGMVYVMKPLKGYFADINLDGSVDSVDFEKFKEQYKTLPDVDYYNPDFNFIEDDEDVVDVREFSKFSREYGRTGVE